MNCFVYITKIGGTFAATRNDLKDMVMFHTIDEAEGLYSISKNAIKQLIDSGFLVTNAVGQELSGDGEIVPTVPYIDPYQHVEKRESMFSYMDSHIYGRTPTYKSERGRDRQ